MVTVGVCHYNCSCTPIFPFTGLASLAELCLRVIVSRDELMNVAEGSYGSGNVAKLIRAQHSRRLHDRPQQRPSVDDVIVSLRKLCLQHPRMVRE